MKARLPIQAALMSLCLSLFATGKAEAYTFTKIADTGASLFVQDLTDRPSINDSGTVVFWDYRDSANGTIFTGNGGAITTIFNYFPRFSFNSSPIINNNGTVVFTGGSQLVGSSIFIIQDGTFTSIDPTLGNNSPSLNDNEAIAVVGFEYPSGSSIYAGSGTGEPFTKIAVTGSPLFSSFGGPSINNSETVAFTAFLDSASFLVGLTPGNQGIFTRNKNGGPISVILDTSGPFSQFGLPASRFDIPENVLLNDEGTLAFLAGLDVGGQGIFAIDTNGSPGLFGTINPVPSGIPTYIPGQDIGGGSLLNNGIISTIADTSGLFSSFDALSFNNQGIAAFLASLDTGGQGIFTGPDPVANKIIAIGDTLFGSTVTRLGFSQTGLNNLGQIAFYAELANGTRGIFRANPDVVVKPVPESNSALGLLAVGGFGAVSVIKRKQKKTLNSAS